MSDFLPAALLLGLVGFAAFLIYRAGQDAEKATQSERDRQEAEHRARELEGFIAANGALDAHAAETLDRIRRLPVGHPDRVELVARLLRRGLEAARKNPGADEAASG